jgi:hypothetical protein
METLRGRTEHRWAHLAGETAPVTALFSIRAIREFRGLSR